MWSACVRRSRPC
ncbi:hypothetical protein F383_36609 [Gossypium arboreum]|nr:hypothetical protein F383_36609 [Gossypium arboreum]